MRLLLKAEKLSRGLIWVATWVAAASPVLHAQAANQRAAGPGLSAKRPVTVADAIQITRLGDPDYYAGGPSRNRVAWFSPDASKFVVILRKGNLARNTNDYSLLLWRTKSVFRQAAPEVLLTMSSSSNRGAIEDITWLQDNETIAFLGSRPREREQLYTFNLRTRHLTRITNHPTDLLTYSITPVGDKVAYFAERPARSLFSEKTRRAGLIVSTQLLTDLVAGRTAGASEKRGDPTQELFVMSTAHGSRARKVADENWGVYPPFLSPDGKYIVTSAHLREMQSTWREYTEPWVRARVSAQLAPGQVSWLERFELIETTSGKSRVLLNAPAYVREGTVAWAPDSRSVAVDGVMLPLGDTRGEERTLRQSTAFAVEVDIDDGEFTKVTPEDQGSHNLVLLAWAAQGEGLVFDGTGLGSLRAEPASPVYFRKRDGVWTRVDSIGTAATRPTVVLREGMNTPPKIVAIDPPTHGETMLWDLNPQFEHLRFGRVEEITWTGKAGRQVKAGLYYPVDYEPGKRYPLVIQTHRWTPDLFWIDGPWSTGFAAQPLAGHNIVVLQVDELNDERMTPKEAENELAIFESAIDYLDGRGLIDREHVGLIGFSRTGFHVVYALTHSKYQFAAASSADGSDGGYWQEMVIAPTYPGLAAAAERTIGAPPFGEGLKLWMERSPGFNADKAEAPLLIQAVSPGSALGMWEWFAALRRLGKPVEMVVLEDGVHALERPWDRRVSLQNNVDWFTFWLKGEEDPDPAKQEQYARWRELRKLHEQQQITADTGAAESGAR